MKKAFHISHKLLTAFISTGVFIQMFFAGLWHSEVFSSPDVHVFFGLGLLLASLLALIAALASRMGRNIIISTAILFGLILLQPILIEQRRVGIPFLSAFHTVNAAFIGMTSGIVAARSRTVEPEATAKAVLSPLAAGD
jgi:hypothetical protein